MRPTELGASSSDNNQSNGGGGSTSSAARATSLVSSDTARSAGQGEHAHAFSIQSQAKGLRAALAARDRDREDRLIARLDDESGSQLLMGSPDASNELRDGNQQAEETLHNRHGIIDADASSGATPPAAVQSELQLPAAIASLPGGLDQNWERLQLYLDGEVGSASDALEQVRTMADEALSAAAPTSQEYDPNAPNPKVCVGWLAK